MRYCLVAHKCGSYQREGIIIEKKIFYQEDNETLVPMNETVYGFNDDEKSYFYDKETKKYGFL